MYLISRNGWLLTKYTGKLLLEQFDGAKEELIEYVSKNSVEYELLKKAGVGSNGWLNLGFFR